MDFFLQFSQLTSSGSCAVLPARERKMQLARRSLLQNRRGAVSATPTR
jgi:hypothetical protein